MTSSGAAGLQRRKVVLLGMGSADGERRTEGVSKAKLSMTPNAPTKLIH